MATEGETKGLIERLRLGFGSAFGKPAQVRAYHRLCAEAADALTAAQAALAERDARLSDWNGMFVAATIGGGNPDIDAAAGIPPLWPNGWHQDCAAVAFVIHAQRTRAEEAERKLAASKPRVLALVGNWLGHNIYVARTEAGGIAFYDTTCGPVAEILDMTVADPDIIRMCLLMLPHLEKNGLPGEKSPRTALNGILHRTTQGIEP